MVWLLILCLIPALSYFGRTLQYGIRDSMGYGVFAWIIATLSSLLMIALLIWIKRKHQVLPLLNLAWVLPLYLVLPLLLERVEERVHFISFGLFGFISMMLFSPRIAFMLCVLLSAGDELFQHFLPDRVGDWHDVGINIVASFGTALFVFFIQQRTEEIAHDDHSS